MSPWCDIKFSLLITEEMYGIWKGELRISPQQLEDLILPENHEDYERNNSQLHEPGRAPSWLIMNNSVRSLLGKQKSRFKDVWVSITSVYRRSTAVCLAVWVSPYAFGTAAYYTIGGRLRSKQRKISKVADENQRKKRGKSPEARENASDQVALD